MEKSTLQRARVGNRFHSSIWQPHATAPGWWVWKVPPCSPSEIPGGISGHFQVFQLPNGMSLARRPHASSRRNTSSNLGRTFLLIKGCLSWRMPSVQFRGGCGFHPTLVRSLLCSNGFGEHSVERTTNDLPLRQSASGTAMHCSIL